MNPQINSAITAYIINEFKLEPKDLNPDFDFEEDLNLSPDQLTTFLEKLQEALSITIPEDKIADIKTLNDLYSALNPDDDSNI